MVEPGAGASRRPAAVRVGALAVLVVALSSLAISMGRDTVQKVQTTHEMAQPPTVVVIASDDQRWDTLDAMPRVQRLLMAHGVTFPNAYATSPACCASRASILTGLYPLHTGVWRNDPPHGGFEAFDDASTLPVWLHDAGSATGLFGKYLNGYEDAAQPYVPPGWTRWYSVWGDYFGYSGVDQTSLFVAGNDESDYSTDAEAARADAFIRETEGPLFVYVGFAGVHEPFTPAPRHRDEFTTLADWRPPSYNEADTSDKPRWVSRRGRLDAEARRVVDHIRLDQYRGLLAVDEGVRRIVRALDDTGRLSTSLIVFTSDNGFTWGEHRLFGKGDPYEESIRVPMVVRYDPVVQDPGRSDDHLVLNIDVAPTVEDATGIAAPPMDGRSLLPLLDASAPRWRRHFLTMKMGNQMPSFCQIHTATRVLTVYETGEEEDYLLSSDPFQLHNLAGSLRGERRRDALRELLVDSCDPPPPDTSW